MDKIFGGILLSCYTDFVLVISLFVCFFPPLFVAVKCAPFTLWSLPIKTTVMISG